MARKLLVGAATALCLTSILVVVPSQAEAGVLADSGGYYASKASCDSQGLWQTTRAGHIYSRWACNWEPHDPPFHLYLYR